MKLLVVCDESSKIIGHRYLNSQISFYIGIIQFGVCVWATAQHVFSIVRFKKVLHCDFVNGTKPVLLVGVDIIIFDIGLFHSLWGIESCVAQHLDGGYGRFTWCICHILALITSLPFAFVSRPRPCALWPLLIQQSAYGIGLLILSLSALPRILPIFTGYPNGASLFALAVYIFGTAMNSFLLYIYWHWYWYVESMWSSARKLRPNHIIVNPNMRSKRTLIRKMPEDQLLNGSLINPVSTTNKFIKERDDDTLEMGNAILPDKGNLTLTHEKNNNHHINPYATKDSDEQSYIARKKLYKQENEFSPPRDCSVDTREYKIGSNFYEETSSLRKIRSDRHFHSRRGSRKLPTISNSLVRDVPCLYDNYYPKHQKPFDEGYGLRKKGLTRRLLPVPPHQILQA